MGAKAHCFGVALAAGVLTIASPKPCLAQAHPGATSSVTADDDFIASGIELRKQGRDAEALKAFESANALRPSARASAQIALAHEALGHWREAERGLLGVLVNATDDWVIRHRAPLETSLAAVREHLAWLDIRSNVEETEVWIAGERVGRLPLGEPLRIGSGDLVVEVRAPGYEPIDRVLHVEAGSRVEEGFTFVGPPARGATPVIASPPVLAQRLPATRDGLPSATRTAGWVALAGAGALLAVGVAGAVTREWEALLYDDDSRCGPTATLSRYARCGTQRDIGVAAQTVAITAFIGAGLSGAVSGVLLLRAPGSAPTAPVALRVRCGPFGLGVSCGANF